ncbi:hypothetical protein GE061_007135 [Apolygus lucorum]|uniref:Uncharacterized protein n=1 Tax=Apolygus lucorum TaxID=248454 RepID=A0A6A4INZ8_APOLU|nr:hypothetical protein GE061_007135 [Apolygus lucorum]
MMARLAILAIFCHLWATSIGVHVMKRQSEVDDLTKNNTKTQHNALGPRILTGRSNISESLVARTITGRYVSDVTPLPVSIEVKEGSALVSEPGRFSEIIFDVTSNLPSSRLFTFTVQDTANYRASDFAEPSRAYISFGNTVQTRVRLSPPLGSRSGGNPSIITFSVWLNSEQQVTKKAYFYIGSESYDSYSPEIWYDFDGDCSGSVSPRNCDAKTWKATINIQDSDSGLLKLRSDPVGIILEKEFIVGTKDVVRGIYTSSCCQTKVDITATDTLGNVRIKYIDIEKRWLSAGDIAAIVLACILLIIIIAFIVWMIVICCRRRRAKLSIYPKHSRREES